MQYNVLKLIKYFKGLTAEAGRALRWGADGQLENYDPSTGGGVSSWNDLADKPAAFPPEGHNHVIADVDGLEQALTDKAATLHNHEIADINGLTVALEAKVEITDYDIAMAAKQDSLIFDVPYNVPTLDENGKLQVGQLPGIAITSTYVVGSQSEQDDLAAEEGDVAIRSDLNKCYIMDSTATWQELLTPPAGVVSFNGRAGSVTPTTGDYTQDMVGDGATYTRVTAAEKTAWDGKQAALGFTPADAAHEHAASYEQKNSNIQAHISSTSNPHGTTAAQIGALGLGVSLAMSSRNYVL